MIFTPPLAIGTTNAHWVKISIAHIYWMYVEKLVDQETYDIAREQLEALSSDIPEPSFVNFKSRAFKVLSKSAVAILDQIPERFANHCGKALVMKDSNEFTFRKYYEYRNNLRNIAFANKDLFQILDSQVTTVGYQFALFYNNFRVILVHLTIARRYVEIINDNETLISFAESYPADKLDFIARCLDLFNVTTFASSNVNWFVSSMKDIGSLAKGIIDYINTLSVKKQVEVDEALIAQAISSAESLLTAKTHEFEIGFELYSGLFVQMNNAISDVDKVVRTMKINEAVIEEEAKSVDKQKYTPIVADLFARIFDGERKREVFDEIFCEAPEVENMIYKLANQLNNEYRNERKPVCCVGFTEGCIIFLGKIIPLLNFPCHVITARLSFYGAATSGDASKEVELEFDSTKYDGKRVIVFDDILDRGITVKKFLEQAKVKTKALDFKVCMLFAKPNPENVYGSPDFLGYMLPNVWVVGYGFDTLFRHRNADAVGSIKESFKDEKNYPS